MGIVLEHVRRSDEFCKDKLKTNLEKYTKKKGRSTGLVFNATNMSDDGEIDVESDEVSEVIDSGRNPGGKALGLDKRAHHNALERKRRDHIKDSFTNLRDCIPAMSGEKVSRAHILNKATEYIRQMQRCSATRTVEIDDLRKKNEILEEQIHALEQAKATGSAIDNPEDLIASIAEKVQQRQNMRLQNQQKNSPKLQIDATSISNEGKTTTTTESSVSLADSTPSSINVLANNIRTTQNLLNALAKNLPTTSNNPQMRTLATRVLASPLRPGGTNVLPRGVVTATAVPPSFQTSTASVPSSVSQPPSLINTNNAGATPMTSSSSTATPTTSVTQPLTTPTTTSSNSSSAMDTNATLALLVNSLTAENSSGGDSLLTGTTPASLVEAVASAVANSGIPQSDNGQGLDVDLLINKIGQQANELVEGSVGGGIDGPPPSKRVKTTNSSSDDC